MHLFCLTAVCETAGEFACVRLVYHACGRASVKAVASPAVYELDNMALTAYQSLTFQPRTPSKTSAFIDGAAWGFHRNSRRLSSLHHFFQPFLEWLLVLRKPHACSADAPRWPPLKEQKVVWPCTCGQTESDKNNKKSIIISSICKHTIIALHHNRKGTLNKSDKITVQL